MHHPTDRIAHTTAFVTPVMERKIAQWVHPMKDRSHDPSHHERKLLSRRYILLLLYRPTPSYRQDTTNQSLCYIDCKALAGTRNTSMGSPQEIDPMTQRTTSTLPLSYISLSVRCMADYEYRNIKFVLFSNI